MIIIIMIIIIIIIIMIIIIMIIIIIIIISDDDDQFNSYLFHWTTSFQPLPTPVGTAACRQCSCDAPFIESSFITLLASQPAEHNWARLLAAAAPHIVVTGYMYYRFHHVDYVLTTTPLESLSVLGLAPNYVILMSALLTLALTVVAHMVYLANEVHAN